MHPLLGVLIAVGALLAFSVLLAVPFLFLTKPRRRHGLGL